MKENNEELLECSFSGRDDMSAKDGSIVNKSFTSADFNITEIIEKKTFLQLKLEPLNIHISISSKSIKQIFNIISNNDNTELEKNYLEFITFIVAKDELDREEILPDQENQDNITAALDPAYYELLNRTKYYYINIPKINNIVNKINKRIVIKSTSLNKIFLFLQSTIYDMSDYIEVFILSYEDKESANLEEKIILKAKLMGKLSSHISNYSEAPYFVGVKKFNIECNNVNKNIKHNLQSIDKYFINTLDAIDIKETPIAKCNSSVMINSEFKDKEDDNNLKINNIDNILNRNKSLPTSYTNDFNKNDFVPEKKLTEEGNKDNCCTETVCENICHIF